MSIVNGEKISKSQKTKVLVIAESKLADEIFAEYLSNVADSKKINKASLLAKKMAKQKAVLQYMTDF